MEQDELVYLIQNSHMRGRLAELIGSSLEKTAVLIILIDSSGSVLTYGSSKSNNLTTSRDRSMIRQMSELLSKHMQEMMTIAGKETK